jgi:hypothetical protein
MRMMLAIKCWIGVGGIVSRLAGVLILSLLMSWSLCLPLAAQHTPPPGSALRASVLDGLRPTVQAEIGGPIQLVVNELRVLQDWAYVAARPQRPGGAPIQWNATKFREAWASDTMSDLVLALLRADGRGWRVVEYAIGPTDVIWEEWMQTHRLPRPLFAGN